MYEQMELLLLRGYRHPGVWLPMSWPLFSGETLLHCILIDHDNLLPFLCSLFEEDISAINTMVQIVPQQPVRGKMSVLYASNNNHLGSLLLLCVAPDLLSLYMQCIFRVCSHIFFLRGACNWWTVDSVHPPAQKRGILNQAANLQSDDGSTWLCPELKAEVQHQERPPVGGQLRACHEE